MILKDVPLNPPKLSRLYLHPPVLAYEGKSADGSRPSVVSDTEHCLSLKLAQAYKVGPTGLIHNACRWFLIGMTVGALGRLCFLRYAFLLLDGL
jgi:hypothetical protein